MLYRIYYSCTSNGKPWKNRVQVRFDADTNKQAMKKGKKLIFSRGYGRFLNVEIKIISLVRIDEPRTVISEKTTIVYEAPD